MLKLYLFSGTLLLPLLMYSQAGTPGFNTTGKLLLQADLLSSNQPSLSWKNNIRASSGYFTLERLMDTGLQVIMTVKVDSFRDEYRVNDERPLPGSNRYRLKFVTAEGSFSYSQVVTADCTAANFCRLYPNPAENHLIIQASGNAEVKIISITGNILMTKAVSKGLNPFDISLLEKGTYVVYVSSLDSKSATRTILYKN